MLTINGRRPVKRYLKCFLARTSIFFPIFLSFLSRAGRTGAVDSSLHLHWGRDPWGAIWQIKHLPRFNWWLAAFAEFLEERRVVQRTRVWRACAKTGFHLHIAGHATCFVDELVFHFSFAEDAKLAKRVVRLAWLDQEKEQDTATKWRQSKHDWNWKQRKKFVNKQ